MANYGGGDTTQENTQLAIDSNPIIQVGLNATSEDNFYFVENPEEQYIGLYHIHQNGEIMIGEGVLGINHELNSNEIIFKKITYAAIQETRERVSDIFYKIWFESNTLTDDHILSMQTTIRDGIKQTGRTEDEPLVFYKKDRNTLENRKDLQGDIFEQLCRYIFDNNIINLEVLFSLESTPGPIIGGQQVIQYKINFDNGRYKITVAQKTGDEFTDVLNLSQLAKTKTGSKIDADKAREVLDTNIFELLPNQPNRQNQINNFFNEFDNLIGPTPVFVDLNGDTILESAENYEDDEQSRISYENQIDAYVTRLISQSEGDTNNQGKTLEDMRNKLNTYLFDVDNKVQGIIDQRPEYENKSNGFLKIRKPNQAIIIRGQNNDLLEFQKVNLNTEKPSYLENGFTITMWVRFVDKQSSGTLFNFGNPNEIDGSGFRLETRTSIDSNENYRRWIRLVVKDDLIRDNHFGDVNVKRRPASESSPLTFYAEKNFHKLYPEIPTDDLNEWYFICATYNPNVTELDVFDIGTDINGEDVGNDYEYEYIQNKQFWLNHIDENGEVVANSNLGAKCKVEIISKSDLLKARGYKIGDLTIDTDSEVTEPPPLNPDLNGTNTEEEDSNIEPRPTSPPNGFNPMTNPMTGTLSPQEQWRWNGQAFAWQAVETQEEGSSEPIATNTPDDIINFGAGGGNY